MVENIAITLYRSMYKIRKVEEKLYYLFSVRDMPGTMHQCIGQEAVCAGVCCALTNDDYITGTHRGHGHNVAKGCNLNRFMAEMFAKQTGCGHGLGGSIHLADVSVGCLGSNGIVGAGIPIATGAGLSCKHNQRGQVAVSFFGDGASNEGAFHESLNMASVWKLPVLYVCENNMYGYSTYYKRVTNIDNIADRAAAYGMESRVVDGMDALAVYKAASELIEGLRAGSAPVLLECKTYRYLGHSRFEKPVYRTMDEVAEWKRKDPVASMKALLLEQGIADEAKINALQNAVNDEIEAAVKFAEDSPLPEDSLYLNYIYG